MPADSPPPRADGLLTEAEHDHCLGFLMAGTASRDGTLDAILADRAALLALIAAKDERIAKLEAARHAPRAAGAREAAAWLALVAEVRADERLAASSLSGLVREGLLRDLASALERAALLPAPPAAGSREVAPAAPGGAGDPQPRAAGAGEGSDLDDLDDGSGPTDHPESTP